MFRQSTEDARGWTLVELLVVLAVVSVLLALLMPAVQAAREAARRTQCSHHLRQIGVALQTFHDSQRCLPPAGISADDSRQARATKRRFDIPDDVTHGWGVFLLPYLEQQALFDRYRWDRDWRHADNTEVRETKLPLLRCPSSPLHDVEDEFRSGDFGEIRAAITDYAPITSVDPGPVRLNLVDTATRRAPEGMLRVDELRTLNDVLDGTSQTLAMVEDAGRPAKYVAGRQRQSGRVNGSGWTARDNEVVMHGYDSLGQQSPGTCAINCTNSNEIFAFHVGGCMCLFADGSVRFVDAATDLQTVARMITRAAGEAIVR